ncbi:TolC family outer membrane protein [Alcaligenaceae bacterium]|nr:TolC family outer membrane protein [Alcaligenaceae bacterium]
MKNSVPKPKPAGFRLWASLATLGLACSAAVAQPVQTVSATAPLANNAAQAIDLSRAWRLMLLNDHTYQAAISEQAAAQTERSQGRAGLLPQVQAGYSRSKITGTSSQPNFLGRRVSSDLDYDSSNTYVQLRQPLLNYGRYAYYQRGNALAQQGVAVFSVKRQEAGLRLASAYFNVLLAHDDVVLRQSLAASLEGRAKAFEAQYRQSEGTRIDAQETRARLAVARADEIDAQDYLVVASRELQALLSLPPQHIAALRADFPLPPLMPPSLDEWLSRARVNNASVLAAQEAVNVAEAEVDQAASRYLPTMDLVASYGKANSENLSSLSQRSNSFTVGIQVNIPIFTGGYTTASVARARHDRSRLQFELSAALERTLAEVTRQYTNVSGGAERIKALQSAVESGRISLESANKGFALGAWSNLDVLRAEDNLYQAKYELAKAKLEYLQSRLSLAAAAGDLNSGPFDEINDIYLGSVISLNGVSH